MCVFYNVGLKSAFTVRNPLEWLLWYLNRKGGDDFFFKSKKHWRTPVIESFPHKCYGKLGWYSNPLRLMALKSMFYQFIDHIFSWPVYSITPTPRTTIFHLDRMMMSPYSRRLKWIMPNFCTMGLNYWSPHQFPIDFCNQLYIFFIVKAS